MENKQKLQALLKETDALIAAGKRYLELNGTKYPLGEWITLKEYARRFHLESTNVVSNWISRGIVPPQNVITIPELNDLKLIKAVSYRSAVLKDGADN